MTSQHFFLFAWYWDPFAIGLCVAALAGYFLARRSGRAREIRPREAAFAGLALMVLVLALLSPVATLARTYLFSAHMLQHLLLLLVAPPLFLLGLPPARAGSPGGKAGKLAFLFRWTPLPWLAGVGAMWFWHVPVLCNAATTSLGVYRAQILSLLLLGAVFWWPIVGPRPEERLSPLPGIAYLVTACFGCTLLGIYITFVPVSVCSIYMHPADPLGILPLIRNGWGLTMETDQQVGGLLMWVPACLIYLAGSLGLLARWYAGAEATPPLPNPQQP